jgi:hypothetical protein
MNISLVISSRPTLTSSELPNTRKDPPRNNELPSPTLGRPGHAAATDSAKLPKSLG